MATAFPVHKEFSLQSFLSFLEPVPKTPQKVEGQDSQRELRTPITIPTKPSRSPPSSPTTTITASLLGQPPTGLGADSDTRASAESDDVSSDDIGINRVLKTMGRHNVFNTNEAPFNVDPQDFILKETLDDRESYLMDGMYVLIGYYSCSLTRTIVRATYSPRPSTSK